MFTLLRDAHYYYYFGTILESNEISPLLYISRLWAKNIFIAQRYSTPSQLCWGPTKNRKRHVVNTEKFVY